MSVTITVIFDEHILNDPQVCHGSRKRTHIADAPGKSGLWSTCDQCGYQPVECNNIRTAEAFIEAPHPRKSQR